MRRDFVGNDNYYIIFTNKFATFLAGFIITAWQIKVSVIGPENFLMSYN